MKLYLDSSAILKRYVEEEGSETADIVFEKAERGEVTLSLSIWNIGEVLGALDGSLRKGWLSKKQFKEVLDSFGSEFEKLLRLRTMEIIPVSTTIVADAFDVLLEHHIYEADALQIVSCVAGKNDCLLSGDKKLVEVSREAGLKAFDLALDTQELVELLQC